MTKKFKKWVFNIILIISGAIITKLFQGLISKSKILQNTNNEILNYVFPLSIILLILFLVVYVIISLDEWRKIDRNIASQLENIGTTVTYKEKDGIFGEDRKKIPFYDSTNSPLVQAEKEILVFTDSSIKTTTGASEEKQKRENYLKSIEKNVQERIKDGFKYIRITQYPKGTNTPQSSKLTRDHWKRMLKIKEDIDDNTDSEIAILKVDSQRSFSFMLIDNKILEFEVVGYMQDNKTNKTIKYVLGYFTITDTSGKLINKFRKFFDRMILRAQLIDEGDLIPVQNNPEDD